MRIVSNCPLCEEKGLHVIGDEGNMKTQQCINCGFATTDKFVGDRKNNETYQILPDEMKKWSIEKNGKIWIPSIITLPFGSLYPENVDGEMKWAFAEMVYIPEEEQKNYPAPNGSNYTRRYDTENHKIFDMFIEAMNEMNERAKADGPSEIQSQ